ncbi:PDZ serine protease [Mesobacillus campisalis]|uniref:PDZ serine protease n=1 Tax=Mesobacillus campisalis TaxID=1408103 RepID=A0A0M2SY48_9BACI|nr:PDZ domain-containing protein [Mesobacillus campisalis]KKK39489.1 PDZ serine protease [Mesobacillus campisalis]
MFYYLFFLAAYLGISRVKRERKNFHVRAQDAFFEIRQLVPAGLLIGLVLSVVTLGAGLVIPIAAVGLIGVFTLLLGITMKVRFLSPAYTVGSAFFVLIFIAGQDWNLPLTGDYVASLEHKIYPSVAILMGLLLIAEGILIRKNGSKGTSPKLVKSKRGQTVGVHEANRLWMLPVFLLVPGDAIQHIWSWWPVFGIGDNLYSILLVPFAAGFRQEIRGMLPKEAVQLHGGRVTALGVLALSVAIASYWYPLAAIAAVAAAVLGREIIVLALRLHDDNLPVYFSKQNQGVMILGVIPESPAAKMGLQVGELVTKVNGTSINDENSFYEAIQRNAAHCKLEVLDTNGQVRFVQRALYEGDHHQLGILFVQDEKKWDSAAV